MKIKRQDTSIPVFSYVMDIFLFSHPLQLLITQHSLVQFFLHPVNVSLSLSFILRSLYFTLYCTRTLTVSTASWEWTHEANKQKCQ